MRTNNLDRALVRVIRPRARPRRQLRSAPHLRRHGSPASALDEAGGLVPGAWGAPAGSVWCAEGAQDVFKRGGEQFVCRVAGGFPVQRSGDVLDGDLVVGALREEGVGGVEDLIAPLAGSRRLCFDGLLIRRV